MFMPLALFGPNDGILEWVVILVVALLIFGHKLPSVARSLGSSVKEFKKGAREDDEEVKKDATAPAAPAAKAEPQKEQSKV